MNGLCSTPQKQAVFVWNGTVEWLECAYFIPVKCAQNFKRIDVYIFSTRISCKSLITGILYIHDKTMRKNKVMYIS